MFSIRFLSSICVSSLKKPVKALEYLLVLFRHLLYAQLEFGIFDLSHCFIALCHTKLCMRKRIFHVKQFFFGHCFLPPFIYYTVIVPQFYVFMQKKRNTFLCFSDFLIALSFLTEVRQTKTLGRLIFLFVTHTCNDKHYDGYKVRQRVEYLLNHGAYAVGIGQ